MIKYLLRYELVRKNFFLGMKFNECRIKVGNLKSGSIISGRIIVGMGKIRNA